MALSSEDELRLQVLLSQELDAIRIDEAKMMLYALVGGKEMRMQLHPTEPDVYYLKSIRQMLSSHFLGSPGGYPVYLKRWTRMGQIDSGLKNLLLLGEPEAVSAVIHAPSLDENLARYAWWAAPQAENARKMLANPTVASSAFGKDLAHFLMDYMPFETRSTDISHSVSLILQNQLVDNEARQRLWNYGEKNIAYRIGFLLGASDDIPLRFAPHPDRARFGCDEGQYGHIACHLKKSLSGEGQAYLSTLALAISNASDQDDMINIFTSIKDYFQEPQCAVQHYRDIAALEETAQVQIAAKNYPAFMQPLADAVSRLSRVTEVLLDKPFGVSDAVGSLMRDKISVQTDTIQQWIDALCWEDAKKAIAESDSGRHRKRQRGQRPSHLQ